MSPWRKKLYEVIFEAETKSGKAFDLALIWAVIFSIGVVLLESVESIRLDFRRQLYFAEWVFTILFTFEYFLRIISVDKPKNYIFSFFGLVDLFSIIPTYLSLFIPGTQGLLLIRGLRLLRIFRVLKLNRYTKAGNFLLTAISHSRHKIIVFLGYVITTVFILGAVMYLIEGKDNGFTSIPKGIYWAIVTMTTVGYGDISPQTPFGQFIASFLMIAGYGIIAVPTGILSAEMAQLERVSATTKTCKSCLKEYHNAGANFCDHCGEKLIRFKEPNIDQV